MAFWGVYLKPNEPYTLHFVEDAFPNRLRITQATLGDATRNSPARSVVRCSVGDKPAIAICSLSVKELTCCQLDLEFEESHDVVFSVMGPRGVYIAGYLVTSARQHSTDPTVQEEMTMIRDVLKDDLDSNKTGLVRKSIDAQNTRVEHSDKNIKGKKHMLKCFRDKNIEGNIITLDQKTRMDGNEGSYNEVKEKTIAVKTHSVFGKLLEKKRAATEKKNMKRNRNRSSGAREGYHDNMKERKKKRKRSKDGSGKEKKQI